MLENKSIPGRDLPGEGEAVMRSLVVAFFEKAEESQLHDDGLMVQPCEGKVRN